MELQLITIFAIIGQKWPGFNDLYIKSINIPYKIVVKSTILAMPCPLPSTFKSLTLSFITSFIYLSPFLPSMPRKTWRLGKKATGSRGSYLSSRVLLIILDI